jgi:hypothetical protein
MTGKRILASALAVGVLAAVAAVQAAGARDAAKVHTLLTTKTPIRAFAQEAGRIAWIGGKWHVDVRGTGRRPKTILVGSAHPSPRGAGGPSVQLALAGSRVLWTSHGGGNDFETALWARKAGSRSRARIVFLTAADREERTGSYFGGLAGIGSTLAYTTVQYDCVDPGDCTALAAKPFPASGTFLLDGTSWNSRVPVPNAPGALALAVSGGRIAMLPAPTRMEATQVGDVSSPSLAAPGTPVEIRDTATGAVVAQFTPPGTVRALALSGSVAAVVDDLGGGTTAIERYDASTGAWLGTTTGLAVDNSLAVSGHTLVFSVGKRKIEAIDATTGAPRVLAVSPGAPIGLSVVGKRVAWAVNGHGQGRVLALTLP